MVGIKLTKNLSSLGEKKKVKVRISSASPRSAHFRISPSYKISPESLKKVRRVISEDVNDAVEILEVLSDPIRLHILKALRIKDLCVCVFASFLKCEYSKLSYHLKLLRESRLVDYRKEGNFLIYYLTELGKRRLKSIEKLTS